MTRKQTMTPKKFKACMDSLVAANAARKAKATFGVWKCAECGSEAPATVHQKRKKYCSRKCIAKVYSVSSKGAGNPNYKNSGWHECANCGEQFKRHWSGAKFCTVACYQASAFHVRARARKDANHFEVIEALELGGVRVLDASMVCGGFPDLIVLHNKEIQLVEVKNPKTPYGRKGLTDSQRKFVEGWAGSPVYVIRTPEDCANFCAGRYEAVESHRAVSTK